MIIRIGVGAQNYLLFFFSFDLYYTHIQNWRQCTFLYHKHYISCINNNEQCPERKSFSLLIYPHLRKNVSLFLILSLKCTYVFIYVCRYMHVCIFSYTHVHAYLCTPITYSSIYAYILMLQTCVCRI